MKHPDRFRYHGRYEASRQPQSAGTASPTRHRAAEEGLEPVGCGRAAGVRQELGVPLASDRQAGGAQRSGPQADPGPTSEALRLPAAAPRAAIAAGTATLWLWGRPLDAAPDRRPDRSPVSRPLSPRPRVAALTRAGVELSEAGASGAATERSGECLLAGLRL